MIEITWLDAQLALHFHKPDSLADALHTRVALVGRGYRVRVWVGGKLMGVR